MLIICATVFHQSSALCLAPQYWYLAKKGKQIQHRYIRMAWPTYWWKLLGICQAEICCIIRYMYTWTSAAVGKTSNLQSVAPQFSPLLSTINKKQGDIGVEAGRKGDGYMFGLSIILIKVNLGCKPWFSVRLSNIHNSYISLCLYKLHKITRDNLATLNIVRHGTAYIVYCFILTDCF